MPSRRGARCGSGLRATIAPSAGMRMPWSLILRVRVRDCWCRSMLCSTMSGSTVARAWRPPEANAGSGHQSVGGGLGAACRAPALPGGGRARGGNGSCGESGVRRECECVFVRLRRGGGADPTIRTVLNMWTTSTRLHSGELSGWMFGCRGGYESDALAHYLVCANSRGVLRAVGDEAHEEVPTPRHCGVGPSAQLTWRTAQPVYRDSRQCTCPTSPSAPNGARWGGCQAHPIAVDYVYPAARLAWSDARRTSAALGGER